MLEPPPHMRMRVEHVGRRRRRRRATRSRNPVDTRGRRAQLQLQAVLKSREAEKVKGGRDSLVQIRGVMIPICNGFKSGITKCLKKSNSGSGSRARFITPLQGVTCAHRPGLGLG